MVWSQDAEAQRPPLSVILPRLYLGAERDVTQELLSSLGISYVLSVSRCSPRPPFLPPCRFLRIPIDDSLWADLLPWIPQALCFIDAAMSSGGAVLVHCAAGISRSPALAVAYIMYRLEMDLDHAYRFVKERRPSISPNFNFLGQLQHFQGTLTEKSSSCDLVQQNLEGRQNQVNKELSTGGGGSGYWWAQATWTRTCSLEDSGTRPEPGTLDPTPAQSPQRIQEAAVSPGEPSNYGLKDSRPQLPSGTAALQEKRRSLSLSLTPLGSSLPPSIPKSENSTAPPGLGWDRLKVESRTESGPWREKPVDTRPASRAEPVNCSPASRVESGPYGGETRSDSPAYRPEGKEQRVLSPFSITLCRLLDWGGRLLLGALVPPVRMGRPALPYKS